MRLAVFGAYPLMDNTEARDAEIARKMVATGEFAVLQVQYGLPFWSKPPLSMGLTGALYLGLGINEFDQLRRGFPSCLPPRQRGQSWRRAIPCVLQWPTPIHRARRPNRRRDILHPTELEDRSLNEIRFPLATGTARATNAGNSLTKQGNLSQQTELRR